MGIYGMSVKTKIIEGIRPGKAEMPLQRHAW